MRFLIVAACLASLAAAAPGPLRFQITLSPTLSPTPLKGRLLVFLSNDPKPQSRLGGGFSPTGTWIAAHEIPLLKPGEPVLLNPDLNAFPIPFSQAPPGSYQVMALLDLDHSYARNGQGPGDLFSDVVALASLNPADTEPVQLTLIRKEPDKAPLRDTEHVKLVEFESPMLTAFWGRPILMRAGVVLPPAYAADPQRRFPASYVIHGFGGDHSAAWNRGPAIVKEISEGKRFDMIHVFLDASFPTGHHVFADSVNNGPWGRALVEELIPHLESRFRLIAKPSARFLTGHSSGGWSSLWVQVSHPDFFGGTWSTAPDPVDLRSFTGIDATPGSTQNAYKTKDGRVLNLVRRAGKELASLEEFVRQEEAKGEFGGQIASFEWVWSPRGKDGRPQQLFDRATGVQNPEVQRYWQRYDIRNVLESGWATLGEKLRGKLHIVCGTEDNFHLEEGVYFLCDFLKSKGREDACEIVPGRDHGDLYQPYQTYPAGLHLRIDREMKAAFEKAARNGN